METFLSGVTWTPTIRSESRAGSAAGGGVPNSGRGSGELAPCQRAGSCGLHTAGGLTRLGQAARNEASGQWRSIRPPLEEGFRIPSLQYIRHVSSLEGKKLFFPVRSRSGVCTLGWYLPRLPKVSEFQLLSRILP